ncbi:DUF5412 family protein [Rossellomorea marisflavi]|uniref:DUF5412 family protein n=1 Tax=Rossellomorea marisflavi TaxID=189381 RepID=UPI003D2EBC40
MLKNFLKNFVKEHKVGLIITLSFIVGTTAIIIGIISFLQWSMFDIQRFKPGEFITEETSPNGDYTVKTFLNSGGATVDWSVLGVLYFNNNDNEPKNIYFQYEEVDGIIEWVDNDTVRINDQTIEVPDGFYDYRRKAVP